MPVSVVGVNISKTGNYTILITVSINSSSGWALSIFPGRSSAPDKAASTDCFHSGKPLLKRGGGIRRYAPDDFNT
ncbi:hypothetical protein YU82_002657, partial [Salmonella enterica subsp. salamae]|nr:hypothetical protein [Salmonella enterica subsp. salamae]